MLSIQLLFPEDFFPYTAGSQAASHQNAVHIQLSDRPAQQTFVCRVSGRVRCSLDVSLRCGEQTREIRGSRC